MIPVQLRYGAEKSRLVILLLGGGIAAAAILLKKLLGDGLDLSQALAILDSVPDLVFCAAAAAFCIPPVLLSIAVSIRILEKKEL